MVEQMVSRVILDFVTVADFLSYHCPTALLIHNAEEHDLRSLPDIQTAFQAYLKPLKCYLTRVRGCAYLLHIRLCSQ